MFFLTPPSEEVLGTDLPAKERLVWAKEQLADIIAEESPVLLFGGVGKFYKDIIEQTEKELKAGEGLP